MFKDVYSDEEKEEYDDERTAIQLESKEDENKWRERND